MIWFLFSLLLEYFVIDTKDQKPHDVKISYEIILWQLPHMNCTNYQFLCMTNTLTKLTSLSCSFGVPSVCMTADTNLTGFVRSSVPIAICWFWIENTFFKSALWSVDWIVWNNLIFSSYKKTWNSNKWADITAIVLTDTRFDGGSQKMKVYF
jgi:hypothetical protein